jgi:hypothetical protein
MTNLELELKVISLFVMRSKRQRLKGFVESDNRKKLIREINDPDIFDEKYVTEFKGGDRNYETLLAHYKSLGIGGRVYVISEYSDWDQMKFQTSYFLEECLARGLDTIAFSWTSDTAFYEHHHSGYSYFLSRNKGA